MMRAWFLRTLQVLTLKLVKTCSALPATKPEIPSLGISPLHIVVLRSRRRHSLLAILLPPSLPTSLGGGRVKVRLMEGFSGSSSDWGYITYSGPTGVLHAKNPYIYITTPISIQNIVYYSKIIHVFWPTYKHITPLFHFLDASEATQLYGS